MRRSLLISAVLMAGVVALSAALMTGCGTSTREQVQRDAAKMAAGALARAGIPATEQTGPMSCAQVASKVRRQSLWRCSAALASGARVQCEVRFLREKGTTRRTSCGGTIAGLAARPES